MTTPPDDERTTRARPDSPRRIVDSVDRRLHGIFCVLATPLTGDGHVDREAVAALVDTYITRGVHGLVVAGSNGELPYLTDAQWRALVGAACRAAGGRIPVVAGVADMSTANATARARAARELGADAVLVALPVYYPLDFAQVREHYRQVSGAGGLPVLYYHFPSHAHLALEPDEIAALARLPGVVGAKMTVLDQAEIDAVIEKTAAVEGFAVFAGIELCLLDTLRAGGAGAISVLSGLVPEAIVECYESFRRGDLDRAAEIHAASMDLIGVLGLSAAPHAVFKEALAQRGYRITADVSPPLPPLTPEQKTAVSDILARSKL